MSTKVARSLFSNVFIILTSNELNLIQSCLIARNVIHCKILTAFQIWNLIAFIWLNCYSLTRLTPKLSWSTLLRGNHTHFTVCAEIDQGFVESINRKVQDITGKFLLAHVTVAHTARRFYCFLPICNPFNFICEASLNTPFVVYMVHLVKIISQCSFTNNVQLCQYFGQIYSVRPLWRKLFFLRRSEVMHGCSLPSNAKSCHKYSVFKMVI